MRKRARYIHPSMLLPVPPTLMTVLYLLLIVHRSPPIALHRYWFAFNPVVTRIAFEMSAAAVSSRLGQPCCAFRRSPGARVRRGVTDGRGWSSRRPAFSGLGSAAARSTAWCLSAHRLIHTSPCFSTAFLQLHDHPRSVAERPGSLRGRRSGRWRPAAPARMQSKAGLTSPLLCPLLAAAAGAPPMTSWQTRSGVRCTWTSRAGTCELSWRACVCPARAGGACARHRPGRCRWLVLGMGRCLRRTGRRSASVRCFCVPSGCPLAGACMGTVRKPV